MVELRSHGAGRTKVTKDTWDARIDRIVSTVSVHPLE